VRLSNHYHEYENRFFARFVQVVWNDKAHITGVMTLTSYRPRNWHNLTIGTKPQQQPEQPDSPATTAIFGYRTMAPDGFLHRWVK
jgi:hypothetical protein